MKYLLLALTVSLFMIGNGECKTLPQMTKNTPIKIQYKDPNGTLKTRSGRIVDHTADSITILQNNNQTFLLASSAILTIFFLEDDIVVRFNCIEDFFTVLEVLFNPEKAFQVEQPIPTQTDTYTKENRAKPFDERLKTFTPQKPSRFKPKKRSRSNRSPKPFKPSSKKFSFKGW